MSHREGRPVVKLICTHCGGKPRRHAILAEQPFKEYDEQFDTLQEETYQICQFNDCERVRFRHHSYFSGTGDETVEVYPEVRADPYPMMSLQHISPDVQKIYGETIRAMNAGAAVLSGGGLRAIVAAICKHQGVAERNLQHKIDSLVQRGRTPWHLAQEPVQRRLEANALPGLPGRPRKQDDED